MVTATAYKYDMDARQALYIGGQGLMTIVTVQSSTPGQQQQASHQFETGKWTAVPLLYALGNRVVIVIATLKETYYLQVQGGQTQMSAGALPDELETLISKTHPSPLQAVEEMPAAAMPPVQPMQPMEPMKPMEPMQMSMNPMSMSLGNMAMSMGTAAASTSETSVSSEVSKPTAVSKPAASKPATAADSSETAGQTVKRFCSQCGSGIEPGDRFCAYCSHQLV